MDTLLWHKHYVKRHDTIVLLPPSLYLWRQLRGQFMLRPMYSLGQLQAHKLIGNQRIDITEFYVSFDNNIAIGKTL